MLHDKRVQYSLNKNHWQRKNKNILTVMLGCTADSGKFPPYVVFKRKTNNIKTQLSQWKTIQLNQQVCDTEMNEYDIIAFTCS